MIEVKKLNFRYQKTRPVLRDVSFSLEEGTFLAILGNNGVGKSTLLKCMNKIMTPETGEIFLDGEDILRMSVREAAKRIAFVSQTVPDTRLTVHDVVMLGRKPYMQWGFSKQDHAIVHEAMDALGLLPMRGRYLQELSGGERQKAALARALAQQPKLLLLDEPTSSLDICNQYQVLELVKEICHERNITVMMVIHDLNLALRFCDRFLLLREGQVYRSGDATILDRRAIRDVYHVNGEVVSVHGQKMVVVDSPAENGDDGSVADANDKEY